MLCAGKNSGRLTAVESLFLLQHGSYYPVYMQSSKSTKEHVGTPKANPNGGFHIGISKIATSVRRKMERCLKLPLQYIVSHCCFVDLTIIQFHDSWRVSIRVKLVSSRWNWFFLTPIKFIYHITKLADMSLYLMCRKLIWIQH